MADAAAQQDDPEARRQAVRQLMASGMTLDQAAAKVRSAAPQRVKAAPASQMESLGRGALQGATAGFADEASASLGAAMQKATTHEPESYAEVRRRYLESDREANRVAQESNPKTYLAGQVGGGVGATALAAPLLPAKAAGAAAATLKGAAASGAAYGALYGLGESEADLTKGEVGQAAADTAIGGAGGGAFGAAGHGLAKGLSAAGSWLKKVGRARLFKGAVGQNKRAFTQINGKDLFEKSTEYLDEMGIGLGDTTESIAEKLSKRSADIDAARAALVQHLDDAGPAAISPVDVAIRIEKEVAEPLKKLAANQAEYRQAMEAVDDIVGLGRELSFSEAAAQRRAVQEKINYDVVNKLNASAEVKRKIAKIWNEVIDENAEPILKKLGEEGDAYRELRHEYALVSELLGHAESRVAGNAANRVISPSDYGAGGVAAVMTGNPFATIAAATANHLGRVYGNPAAGRAAINIGRMAAGSESGMRALLPAVGRALHVSPKEKQTNQPQDQRASEAMALMRQGLSYRDALRAVQDD